MSGLPPVFVDAILQPAKRDTKGSRLIVEKLTQRESMLNSLECEPPEESLWPSVVVQ
jgi:hypothetical protein